MTTRFMMDYTGKMGEFWQKKAYEQVAEVAADVAAGRITIVNGVPYNSLNRILPTDMIEMVSLAGYEIDLEAIKRAESEEIEALRRTMRNHRYNAEEIAEMRSDFGAGTTVVDVLTGRKIHL